MKVHLRTTTSIEVRENKAKDKSSSGTAYIKRVSYRSGISARVVLMEELMTVKFNT